MAQKSESTGRAHHPRKRPTGSRRAAIDRPLLPPERAFVVQFVADADIRGKRCAGRIEHVVSGRSIRFETLDSLVEFIDRSCRTQTREHQ